MPLPRPQVCEDPCEPCFLPSGRTPSAAEPGPTATLHSVLRSHGEGTLCLHTRGGCGPRPPRPSLGTLAAHNALPTVGSLARHAKQWCQNVLRLPGREAGGEGWTRGLGITWSSTRRLLGAMGRGSAGQPAGLWSPQLCVRPGWGGTQAMAEMFGGWVRTPSQIIWSLSAGPFLSQGYLRPSVCTRAPHFPECVACSGWAHGSTPPCIPVPQVDAQDMGHATLQTGVSFCYPDALKKQDVRW